HDEEQRIRDRESGIGDHPGLEEDDESAELVADLAGVRIAENRRYDAASDESDEPRRGTDESQGDPRRVDDVLRSALRIDAAAGQRGRGDERQRERGRSHEGRGQQVGVRQARDVALARAGRKAQRNQIEPLQRERYRRAVQEPPKAMSETQRNVRVTTDPASAQNEDDDGQADRDRTVEREAPGQRDEAVRVGEHDEEDDADDASERE